MKNLLVTAILSIIWVNCLVSQKTLPGNSKNKQEFNQKEEEDFYGYVREMIEILKEDGRMLKKMPKYLKKEKRVVLVAVENCGAALEYAHRSLKKDREIALNALKNDCAAFKYAHSSLKKDKDFVLGAFNCHQPDDSEPEVFYLLNNSLQKDRDIVLAAMNRMEELNEHLSKKIFKNTNFRTDKELLLKAIRLSYGSAFQYADESLKKDKEFVLAVAALTKTTYYLKYADESLMNDPEFIEEVHELLNKGNH